MVCTLCDFEVPKMGHQHGGFSQRQLQLLGSLMYGFLHALSNDIWQVFQPDNDALANFGPLDSQ